MACTYHLGSAYEDVACITAPDHLRQQLGLVCATALCANIAARGRTASWSCSRGDCPSRLPAWTAGFRLERAYVHHAVGRPAHSTTETVAACCGQDQDDRFGAVRDRGHRIERECGEAALPIFKVSGLDQRPRVGDVYRPGSNAKAPAPGRSVRTTGGARSPRTAAFLAPGTSGRPRPTGATAGDWR